jgi:hypothetical protein
MPWAGWGQEEPRGHQRTVMKRDCGRKCFLGPNKSFPVCRKHTCDVSKKGLWAAYIRAREWGQARRTYRGKARPRHARRTYTRIANRARQMLRSRGAKPGWHGGKSTRRSGGSRRRR